ncbi:MAG TPA: response regulator [Chthoniobacteraceae bacterium]|nr:response regulator [Chthoniobacteraceae bacterium]
MDDESGFTKLLKLILPGYTICEENNATKAVETALRFQPDLIFLDVIMPDMDGGAVAAEIRAQPLLSRTPIVFLTAIVSPAEAGGTGLIGGFPFLAKPVKKEKLIECINRHLPD